MRWKEMYYDKKGEPLTRDAFVVLRQTAETDYWRVALTENVGPMNVRVSTVWLGIDHNFGIGAPLIFETMVFHPRDSSELECRRWATEHDARIGHEECVKRWSKILEGEDSNQ